MGSTKFKNNRETNNSIHTVSKKNKNVMGSSAKLEVGPLIYNGQEAEPIHTNLH